MPIYVCIYITLMFLLILGFVFLYLLYYHKDKFDDDLASYKPFPDYNEKVEYLSNYGNCTWIKRNFTPHYDHSKDSLCRKVINYANQMNVTYFLSFGSELQAYRNNGIYKDHDFDIVVPIWLNPHLFNCSDYVPINKKKYPFNSVILDHTYRLCGRRRRHYLKRLARYLKEKIGYYSVIFHSYCLHVILDKNDPYLDVWLIMSNEFVYDKIQLCKCQYCGIETYCATNIVENIIRNNGIDFMTPKQVSGEEPVVIPRPI